MRRKEQHSKMWECWVLMVVLHSSCTAAEMKPAYLFGSMMTYYLEPSRSGRLTLLPPNTVTPSDQRELDFPPAFLALKTFLI